MIAGYFELYIIGLFMNMRNIILRKGLDSWAVERFNAKKINC